MKKIWIIESNVYKTEAGFLNALKWYENTSRGNVEYSVFELSEQSTIGKYREQSERDISIRSVLGELSKEEIRNSITKSAVEELISVMSKNLSNALTITGSVDDKKSLLLHLFTKYKDDPKGAIRFIKSRKSDMLQWDSSPEYYKALLSVYNFRSLAFKEPVLKFGRIVMVDKKLSDDHHRAFRMAKIGLKNG